MTSTYTRHVASRAHRVISVVLAFALSGSPAVLSACTALCLDSPVSAASLEPAVAGHHGHGAMAEVAPASPHAHHSSPASPRSVVSTADPSPQAHSAARLIGACDSCCNAGSAAVVAGPGVERTSGQALAMAPAVAVASFQPSVTTQPAAPPSAPVPPPSPTRAPLTLRI